MRSRSAARPAASSVRPTAARLLAFAAALVLTALAAVASTRPLGAQVPQREYAERRARLGAALPEGVLLALGAPEPAQNFLSFFQSTPFDYLTGFHEPDAALVMVKRGGRATSEMFVQAKDASQEVWTGAREGAAAVAARTGLAARDAAALPAALDSLVASRDTLYVVGAGGENGVGEVDEWPKLVRDLAAAHPRLRIVNATGLVARLRGTKSAAELDLLRKSAAITADAHRAAVAAVRPDANEFEAQAAIEYTFRRNGADRPSFASIVGSGPNSTTLHYSADDRFMRAGEVVVMDIGASYRGYAADVTRTVPVSGTFTPAQRLVYQLVRDAQAAAERQAVPGARARLMSDSATAVLTTGLARLGLIESPLATYDCGPADQQQRAAQCPQFRLYYMHGLGHAIGLDVHDFDQYYDSGVLAPGSAFTIEPGVYVRRALPTIVADTPRNRAMLAHIAPALRRFADVGVRIEDDYLVTERGVEWISRAPRELGEVEAAMRAPHPALPRDAAKVDWYRRTP